MKLTLAEAAIGAGAVLEAPASVANAGALMASGYSIDSRTVAAGELFFAVRGERLDGHDFVTAALERGAVAAVVSRARAATLPDAALAVPLFFFIAAGGGQFITVWVGWGYGPARMIALALAVKLTSRGPVFYRQTRTGLGGQTFSMLKFRSMYLDAEGETGPVWASRRDGRCTPLGRLLRCWSLDELPQLFNVLGGDMSLVGPRPERGVFVEQFRRQIPGYCQRHRVKCGITGWAQVHGWRGNTSLRHRVQCDLYYISHWSLGLDLKILWLTLWRGLHHRNAY